MGGPPVVMEIACRQVIAQSFGRDSNVRRFAIDFHNSKDMVFNVKTLLNDDIDLTLWRRGKSGVSGMSGRSCGFRPLVVCFCWQKCLCQHRPRAVETACGPLGPEDISWWKIHLLTDSAPTHMPWPPSSCWWNSVLQWIGRHICWTWTHWTSLTGTFCRQKSRWRLTLIWMPYICPLTWNGAGWRWNTSTRSAAHSAGWCQENWSLNWKDVWTKAQHRPRSTFQG